MSNQVVPIGNNALATAQAAFADDDFTGKVAQTAFNRIGIKGGVFRRFAGKQEVDAIESRSLEVVVINAALSIHREFYKDAYVEGVEAVPVCWSSDSITPDADVTMRQAVKCETCPQNAKGSGQNGSKACRYAQRIAVVLANDMEGTIYAMRLPAMSVFGDAKDGYYPFRPYMTYLKANKAPAPSIVTEMRFDTTAAVPKLMFRPKQPNAYIGDDKIDTIKAQMAHEDAKRAVELKIIKQMGSGPDVARPAMAAQQVQPAVAQPIQSDAQAAPVADPRPEPPPSLVPEHVASKMAGAITEWAEDE